MVHKIITYILFNDMLDFLGEKVKKTDIIHLFELLLPPLWIHLSQVKQRFLVLGMKLDSLCSRGN